jgi:hypothetical protein
LADIDAYNKHKYFEPMYNTAINNNSLQLKPPLMQMPSLSVIRPSTNQLLEMIKPFQIKALQQQQNPGKGTPVKNSFTKPYTPLMTITLPPYQLPNYNNLLPSTCSQSQQKLCTDDTCRVCYENSFASIGYGRPQAWSAENQEIPRNVKSNRSRIKFWFDCPNKCGHRFERYIRNTVESIKHDLESENKSVRPFLCGYCCDNEVCSDDSCQKCLVTSLLLHPMGYWWSDHKVNGINLNGEWTPRMVSSTSNFSAWFQCEYCFHLVLKPEIRRIGRDPETGLLIDLRCPYCCNGQKKFCEAQDCLYCYLKSVAGHERMSKCWIDSKNALPKHQVARGCNANCWFLCDICKKEFYMEPNNILSGQWCGACSRAKTEKFLGEWLTTNYPDLTFIHDKSTEWSGTGYSQGKYRYDFRCEEIKTIVELDGPQHFEQTSNWDPPEKTQRSDFNKMNKSFEFNYATIRLPQLDVQNNVDNWEAKLKYSISICQDQNPQIWCIGKIYVDLDYKKKWLNHNNGTETYPLAYVTPVNKQLL